MSHNIRPTPVHHVESAIGFPQGGALLLSGWVVRPSGDFGLEIVCTRGGYDAYPATRVDWFRREDIAEVHGADIRDAGFRALVELPPEALDGPLYLAFCTSDGARILGPPIGATPLGPETLAHAQGLFAASRGLAPAGVISRRPLPLDLLTAAAAPPEEGEEAAFWVDHAVALPDGSVYVAGWAYARRGFERLVFLDDAGNELADLLDDGVFFRRRDVTTHLAGAPGADGDLGFAIRVSGPADRMLLVGVTKGGQLYGRALQPAPIEEGRRGATWLVDTAPADISVEADLMARHLGDSLAAILRPGTEGAVYREHAFGPRCEEPQGAVVIATEGDIQWLRYQLAALSDEPELFRWEIRYVVWDADVAHAFLETAADVHEHFGVGLSVLVPSRSTSRRHAVNAGVRAAGAEHVLVLGERTLPREPGWLGELGTCLAGDAAIVAVGPKLVSEVRTVLQGGQADGAEQVALPEAMARGEIERDVTHLSAACLLVERRAFLDAGGLPESHWQDGAAERELSARLCEGSRRLVVAPVVVDDLSSRKSPEEPHARLARYDAWLSARHRPSEGNPA